MRRNLIRAEALVLSLVGAWSAVACLCSAFSIPVQWLPMLTVWLLTDFMCIACLSFRRGGWVLLGLNAGTLAAVWFAKLLKAPLYSLLGTILQVYHSAYGFGVPDALRTATGTPDFALGFLGAVVVQCVCIGVYYSRCTVFGGGALLIPLSACLVVTDTVPSTGSLFALLLCLVLLLLTDSVRIENREQASHLLLGALLPVALALVLLFRLVPQETFQNTTQALRLRVLNSLQEMQERIYSGNIPLSPFSQTRDMQDLSSLGSPPDDKTLIASLTVEQGNTVYLRVKDFDRYNGVSWVSTHTRQETLAGTGESLGTIVVMEHQPQQGRLLPAYPSGEILLTGGSAPQGETTFQVERLEAALGARPGEEWLELPQDTLRRAQAILKTIPGATGSLQETVKAIAEYVRSCARYDLEPSRMPGSETDFALWFLESGEQGYCVHFATAAAVLLRSAGIPARYVTGYKVDPLQGQTTQVTTEDAHAWVEYYNYQNWTWTILDATPGPSSASETSPTETQTIPPPTTQPPTTKPTQPPTTEPTVPTEPEPPQPRHWQIPWKLLGRIVLVLLLAGCVELQYRLRVHLRRKLQAKGDANRRALTFWRELTLLTRLIHRPMPTALIDLAEKARYSQHQLTVEELKLLHRYAAHCRRKLQTEKTWKQLIYRYWYAVL